MKVNSITTLGGRQTSYATNFMKYPHSGHNIEQDPAIKIVRLLKDGEEKIWNQVRLEGLGE